MSIAIRCLLLAVLVGLMPQRVIADDAVIVPPDTAAFLSIDIMKVRKNAAAELVKVATDGLTVADWDKFAKEVAFDPNSVERVTLLAPTAETLMEPMPYSSPTAKSALVIVTCSKVVDVEALRKVFAPGSRLKKYKDTPYQFDVDSWSGLIVLPGNKSFVYGSEDSIIWYLDAIAAGKKSDAFAASIADAGKHAVLLAVNPARLDNAKKSLPPDFRVLGDAKVLTAKLDMDAKPKAAITIEFETETAAKEGLEAVKKAAAMARQLVVIGMLELEKESTRPSYRTNRIDDVFIQRGGALIATGFLRRVDKELDALPIVQNKTTVAIEYEKVNIPEWSSIPALLPLAAYLGVSRSYSFAAKDFNPNEQDNLRKKLVDAFEAYHEKHGNYPPATIMSKDGEPLHSWRVALLPFLGEQKLYDEFKLDEPWDSINNKKLIAKMPKVYSRGDSYPPKIGSTRTIVVVGPGTIFDPKVKVKKTDVKDAENTILWIETYDSDFRAYWTEPKDAMYKGETPPNLFPKPYTNQFQAMMADGKWRYLDKNRDSKNIPNMFLRNPAK